ncbi:MAG: cohesin domain-containing protein [Pseudomonadota bacterium]|nr:cohesin domain-containing protein [Pseudomonadota bacterium]
MVETGWRLPLAMAAAILAFFLGSAAAEATEVYIPDAKVKNGQKFVVPVMIDAVDRLAGVKLVIVFDARALQYLEGEKTKQTVSMMHIVNDKNPGRLVIVMAGARGITGKEMALIKLTFQVRKDAREAQTRLELKEAQLMTEQLTEVKATAKGGNITIVP